MGEALFKNICYSSVGTFPSCLNTPTNNVPQMVKCLQYRKKSILKDMIDQIEWRQRDLILFSKGHNLGALLQDLDAYAVSGPANISILGLTQRLGRLLALDVELQIWYRQLLKESPSPLCWRSQIGGEDQGGFSFVNLQLAHLMLDYWALRLILSVTVATLCHQIPVKEPLMKNGSQSPASSSHSDPDEMPVQANDVVNIIQQAKAEHGATRQVDLAVTIMESLPYCMDVENGISSSQKCLFSARVALFLLQRHPSEKLAAYEALYMDLAVNKGLSFARGVGSTLQRWEKQV